MKQKAAYLMNKIVITSKQRVYSYWCVLYLEDRVAWAGDSILLYAAPL